MLTGCGTAASARAEADGYNILLQAAAHSAAPAAYPNAPYDPAKDFAAVAMVTNLGPQMVSVNANVPAKNLAELIAYIKANPGKYSFGSGGVGSILHLCGEQFRLRAGRLDMEHIPYRGSAPALTDLLAGQVDIMFDNLGSSLGHIKAGSLRALAVAGTARNENLPEVPTMIESGVPDFISDTWNALSAPPKTPPAIIAKLNAALNAALKMPEVKSHYDRMHLTTMGGTPERMAEIVKADTRRWGEVIHTANVNID